MIIWISVLSVLLAFSAFFNAFLFFKLKKDKRIVTETYDVKELLRDLAAGDALVRIQRIAPSSVLLRSPRDYS